MGAGEKAGWLALVSGAIIAVIGGLFARLVGGLSRRTEIDKMYMAELVSVRAERDAWRNTADEKDAIIDQKDAVIQELREQHLRDVPCLEREKELVKRIDELMNRLIGSKEPPSKE